MRTYNYWMVLFSATFIGAVVLLMPYGAIGMVVANVLKMACRRALGVAVVWGGGPLCGGRGRLPTGEVAQIRSRVALCTRGGRHAVGPPHRFVGPQLNRPAVA